MRITISGTVGSGKSSVAKIVAEKLGYKYHYIGELMRKMAQKRGMHFSQFQKAAENNPEIDKELDSMQKELGKDDDYVMDSRLGFYFIPDSYKIFLKVDINAAAKRIFDAKRDNEIYKDLSDAKKQLIKRIGSERKRYKKYYNISFPDEKMFDLVIDTTGISIDATVDEIIKAIKIFCKKP